MVWRWLPGGKIRSSQPAAGRTGFAVSVGMQEHLGFPASVVVFPSFPVEAAPGRPAAGTAVGSGKLSGVLMDCL